MASYYIIMISVIAKVFVLISLSSIIECGLTSEIFSQFSDQLTSTSGNVDGTKWAVLVAGSNSYNNYRHQADVCHAYHILKKGGLKDENIIVFMYDDIAYNEDNPRPGVIINSLHGKNVYSGVVKDYTGKDVSANNLYAVLLGNKTALTGGSGKVLKTGPNDHVFIYYSDHGAPGILAMPDSQEMIYAKDFINILEKMHASKAYKSMVIYIEACESGSIFDGLLPKNLSIYVTTASKPDESSYACYCGLSKEYENVCLGDLYSVSWIEDSENCNPMEETLQEQYLRVKERTGNESEPDGYSHVMQYGDLILSQAKLASYMGASSSRSRDVPQLAPLAAVEQREADLFYLKGKVQNAPLGSNERTAAQKKLDEEISYRKHVDQSVAAIGGLLFGEENSPLYKMARPAGQPIVEDWDCFKSMVKTYETYCGSLQTYGRKYMRVFANMCNAGVHKDQMAQAAAVVCAV